MYQLLLVGKGMAMFYNEFGPKAPNINVYEIISLSTRLKAQFHAYE